MQLSFRKEKWMNQLREFKRKKNEKKGEMWWLVTWSLLVNWWIAAFWAHRWPWGLDRLCSARWQCLWPGVAWTRSRSSSWAWRRNRRGSAAGGPFRDRRRTTCTLLSGKTVGSGCAASGSSARRGSTWRTGWVWCSWHCAGRAAACACAPGC